MTSSGYVLLFKKIFDNPVINKTHNHFYVFCWLLTHVAFDNSEQVIFKGKVVKLAPGQILVSVKKLGPALNLSHQQIRSILVDFESNKQINKQADNRNTLITVVSWSKYRVKQQTKQQANNNQITINQQTDNIPTNNINKGIKGINKLSESELMTQAILNFTDSKDLQNALTDYVDMRQTTNFPLNAKEFDYCLKSLQDLSLVERDQIKIVGRAVGGHYQNFAPLPIQQTRKNGKTEAVNAVNELIKKYEMEGNNGQGENS